MPKDWTKIAEALGVPPPQNTSALEALENTLRPLVSAIPFETEPAYILPMHDSD